MVDTTYNGWKNYETWLVKLWFDNDQGIYDWCNEMARDCNETGIYAGRTPECRLADIFKDWCDENIPEVTGLWADLLNAALSEVDWYRIAEAYLEDLEDLE